MWKSFMITTISGKLVICKSFLQSSLSILESIEKFIIIAMSSLITPLPQLVLETTGWLHPNQQTLNSTRRSRGGDGQEEKSSQAFDPQPHSGPDTLDTSVIIKESASLVRSRNTTDQRWWDIWSTHRCATSMPTFPNGASYGNLFRVDFNRFCGSQE